MNDFRLIQKLVQEVEYKPTFTEKLLLAEKIDRLLHSAIADLKIKIKKEGR